MHTGTIIFNFDKIVKEVEDNRLDDHFLRVYEYIRCKGQEYIDDKTDINLLFRCMDLSDVVLTKKIVQLGFLMYIIDYLYNIKRVPRNEIVATCNNLSIDTLKLIHDYNIFYKVISGEINLLLKDLIISKVREAIAPKLGKYTIIFNDFGLNNILKFNTPQDTFEATKFIQSKPFIFLFLTHFASDPYEFTLRVDSEQSYLTQVTCWGKVIMVTSAFRNKNIENKVLENINICAENTYQKLFDNLKNNKFTPKSLQVYYTHEVNIYSFPFAKTHMIIGPEAYERR